MFRVALCLQSNVSVEVGPSGNACLRIAIDISQH